MSGHPPDARLLSWLEHGRPNRIGRHVEACDQCMARVEALSDLDGRLVSGLESVSAPPDDLLTRTTGSVQGRLAAEEAVAAFIDLFALPWQTATVLVDGGADRSPVLDVRPTNDEDLDDEEQPDG
jgi:hypothetical protein